MIVRRAGPGDIDRIDEIYNQAVLEKFLVGDVTPWSKEKRLAWYKDHDNDDYPLYVADVDGRAVGFVYITAYRPGRMALKQTVEISFYIDRDYRGKGIGKILIDHTEAECIKKGIKTMFAIIMDCNKICIKLVEKCGYEKWGHLPKIALFDGIEVGHLYYGKRVMP